jgi:hypothetical protein
MKLIAPASFQSVWAMCQTNAIWKQPSVVLFFYDQTIVKEVTQKSRVSDGYEKSSM